MTVVFICGSVEPMQDGVGDYTRRLSSQLIKSGHTCGILAFYDRFQTLVFDGTVECEQEVVPVLRLPSRKSQEERTEIAESWLKKVNPDWLSLQYVPFSFDRRGLPVITKALKRLGQNRKWHILFHEIWMGLGRDATFNERIRGYMQRFAIPRMVKELLPEVVHVSCRIYGKALASYGIISGHLPLFSNIPWRSSAQNTMPPVSPDDFILVHFGSVHKGFHAADLIHELLLSARKTGKHARLWMLGRGGSAAIAFINKFENEGIPVTCWGMQDAKTIAGILSVSHIGLTTVPEMLSDKSGSIAAMKSFGLPLRFMSKPWVPSNPAWKIQKPAVSATLSEVSLKFECALSDCK